MQHGASQGKEILLDMRDLQARQLRRVTEADSVEGAVKGFLDFWQKDTTIHLNIHEPARLCFRAMLTNGGAESLQLARI